MFNFKSLDRSNHCRSNSWAPLTDSQFSDHNRFNQRSLPRRRSWSSFSSSGAEGRPNQGKPLNNGYSYRANWSPDNVLDNVNFSPYPRNQLQAAKNHLIYVLKNGQTTDHLEAALQKIGIPSKFGDGLPPPPDLGQLSAKDTVINNKHNLDDKISQNLTNQLMPNSNINHTFNDRKARFSSPNEIDTRKRLKLNHMF